jgi:hypothetical protein
MRGGADLRRELSVRGQEMALANKLLHELTAGETPSVIFGPNESRQHGNFYPASYRNICAHPEWRGRLTKIHTASRTARAGATWRWKDDVFAMAQGKDDALVKSIRTLQVEQAKLPQEIEAIAMSGEVTA